MKTHRKKQYIGINGSGRRTWIQTSQKLIKRMVIRIIVPSQNHREVVTLRAKPGRYWTEEQVDQTLMDSATKLEDTFPEIDFRLVCLKDIEFNFVEIGKDDPDHIPYWQEREERKNVSQNREATSSN